jgi:integrase
MRRETEAPDPTRRVKAITWERFKAEVLATWAPPAVSQAHAKHIARTCREIEALDLAAEGEPPRSIATTADLTTGLVARYRAGMPARYSPFTVKQKLAILQALCGFAEANRWVAISPFRLRRMAKWVRTGKPVNKRAASLEEIRRLLDVMRRDIEEREGWGQWRARRIYALTALIAYTGLRKMEALLLHVADLDFGAGMVRLTTRSATKTEGSAQPVPMPPALLPILRDWLDHRMDRPKGYKIPASCDWLFPTNDRRSAWVSGSLESRALARLKVAGQRAGVPDITFHMLRRSLATHLEHFGAGPAMIQRVLRHSDPQVTETHYRRADETNMRDAVKDVEF